MLKSAKNCFLGLVGFKFDQKEIFQKTKVIYFQGWPEKDQSGFNHLVLTGLNHLKKPNFDYNKWSKSKNQDFSEVNINKCLIYKKINVNVMFICLNHLIYNFWEILSDAVYFLSSTQAVSIGVPQVLMVWIGWSIWETVDPSNFSSWFI